MTKQKINKAIQFTGLEIQATRGDGYSYFTSIATGDQVGQSNMVCYLKHLSLEEWVQAAEYASRKG